MACTAKIPVCNGWFTDSLVITPGARNSTSLYESTLYGSFPSRGCPSGLTTLPIISSPTPILTVFPVLLAIEPSLISTSPPRRTHPTHSSSRFSAIPKMSLPKSISSPLMQFSRPYTFTTPSPACTT